MIDNATLILGPPGCGKTHYLIEQMEQALMSGVKPHEIVFVSFTRKAAAEAGDRACAKFDLDRKAFPYLRTLHSLGFHGLGLQRSDMLSAEDYSALGRQLGLILEASRVVDPDDGEPMPSIRGTGAAYLHMIYKARYRGISLEKQFSEDEDYDLHFPILKQLSQALEMYKAANLKFDFVDLIERYTEENDPPYSKLLIVDEAQDLTWLQWQMVKMLSTNSERVLIAGDDDQAIYRWAGAEVRHFIQSAQDRILLKQSYRLPKKVWELSQHVVKRISYRLDKEFLPREEEGELHHHLSLDSIPLDNGETWTVMFRVNPYMYDFAKRMMDEGLVYMIKGKPSINPEIATAILTWRSLQRGDSLHLGQVVDMYKRMPKQGKDAPLRRGAMKLLEAADPERLYDYDLLSRDYGLQISLTADAFDVIRMSQQEALYIAAAERRGVDISLPPKINLSTFHAMKGGEDRNCVVYLGSTRACAEGDQDDETRALYVAITRAKHGLHFLDTKRRYRIEI